MRRTALLLSVLAAVACGDSVEPTDGNPPGPIATLTAIAAGTAVDLSWTASSDRDLEGTLVVRFPTTGVDGKPEGGRTYTAGDVIGTGRAVFSGIGTKTTDSAPCSTQVYAAWARDEFGNWSAEPRTVAVSGVAGLLPAAPTGMTATIDKSTVKLAWSASAAPAFYRVVRQPALDPTRPKDGVPVFLGSGTSVVDATADFSPQVSWHYGVFACNPCGECEATGARATVNPSSTAKAAPPEGLLQALRAGGLIVYWRHTTADVCADRQDLGPASAPQIVDWWKSCERECATALARQLGASGYADAERIGRDVKAKGIPFSSVTSSEYCRTVQTADRMALGPVIQTSKQITFFVYPEIDPCPAAESLFKKVPPAGSNTALVGHLSVPCMSLDMGQAMVLKPDGKGGYAVIAKVQPSEWAGLI